MNEPVPELVGLADVPQSAERVFIRLARKWHEGFAAVRRDYALPRSVDELALSAVLLARECGASFTNAAWQQTEANIVVAEKSAFGAWLDCLPWRLAAAARLSEPSQSRTLRELDCQLNHHNSSIRVWMMELAGMVRPWLAGDTVLPRLLENVANTLAGTAMAWGLAGALFDSEELFHAVVEGWQPEVSRSNTRKE